MMNDKKKKRGLVSMEEKMGLNEGSDYVAPSSRGIIPTAADGGNDAGSQRQVASKVRDKMTGRV